MKKLLSKLFEKSIELNEINFLEKRNSELLINYTVDSSEFCQYDSLNRLIKVIHDYGIFTKYKYDKNGSLKSKKKYDDNKLWQTLTYQDNKVIEELSYHVYSNNKFWSHHKNFHMNNGLINYSIEYNKKGKPVNIIRYHYKIYSK